MYGYLMVLTICATSSLHLWRTIFNNFSEHIIGLDCYHIDILQSIREIPGFLCLLVVYVLLLIREHRLSALSVLLPRAGVAGTGLFQNFTGIICTTLVMCFGFHYFERTNQSLTLQYFAKNQAPLVFGKLRSIASASSIIVSILIFLLSPTFNYSQLYLLFGGLIIIATIWSFTRLPHFSTNDLFATRHKQRSRCIIKLLDPPNNQLFIFYLPQSWRSATCENEVLSYHVLYT